MDYCAAVYELKTGVIIPVPKLQRRLLGVIFSDTCRALHNLACSAISNPYNTKLQNCTEFVLDVLNLAIYSTGDREWIKAHERVYFNALDRR